MTSDMQDHISRRMALAARSQNHRSLFPGAADYLQALNKFREGLLNKGGAHTGAINSEEKQEETETDTPSFSPLASILALCPCHLFHQFW